MSLHSPDSALRITGKDANFSKWQVFFNDIDITRDVSGILIELNRGCLPLVTLQYTTRLDLPVQFNALIEVPKLLGPA